MAVRLYARSMDLNFTPRLGRKVAKSSKRNEGHNSTLRLERRVGSLPNVNKVQNSTLKSAKRAVNVVVLLPNKCNQVASRQKEGVTRSTDHSFFLPAC